MGLLEDTFPTVKKPAMMRSKIKFKSRVESTSAKVNRILEERRRGSGQVIQTKTEKVLDIDLDPIEPVSEAQNMRASGQKAFLKDQIWLSNDISPNALRSLGKVSLIQKAQTMKDLTTWNHQERERIKSMSR